MSADSARAAREFCEPNLEPSFQAVRLREPNLAASRVAAWSCEPNLEASFSVARPVSDQAPVDPSRLAGQVEEF
jgi:hypothetical protein